MTQTSQAESTSQNKQLIFISKATTWAFFLYAPLISFVLNLIVLPGHIILLPYYVIAIVFRGKAPRFLSKWVQFNSQGLYRVRTIEGEICKSFWCLYYIYSGFIIGFVFWTIAVSFAGLIFPILLVIEEWKIITNFIYRLTFGYWSKITNDLNETTVVSEEVVDNKTKSKKKKLSSCPVCGEKLGSKATYCQKCGSLVES